MTAPVRRPGGIVCPLVTPWTEDGGLDEPRMRALIEALLPDLDGVFVLGSSGELPWLPDGVAEDVARVAIDQVAGRVPVYAGVGDTGTRRTLDRAARLAEAGPDFLVATSPFYYGIESDAAIVDHFARIADDAPVPVVLYNIPQNTHCPLSPGAVRALARHPNIVGIKDSAGDWFAFEQFLATRDAGFTVMQGREQMAAISLWAGADGVISAVANIAPRLLRALDSAIAREQPRPEILSLQATITELAAVFEQGHWLAGLKCALETLGWPVGNPGRPIVPYDAARRAAVDEILSAPGIRRWLLDPPRSPAATGAAR